MPCRLNADVHEGSNEVPTVPAYDPVNLPPGEQSRDTQREEKTLWSFTAACRWGVLLDVQCRQETSKPVRQHRWSHNWDTTLPKLRPLLREEDPDRWAVCLGRDALEKISRARNG